MSRPLVIAEAGVNHNGDLGRARDMVAAAAEAGADYIKFQGFRADEIVVADASTAAYQAANTGVQNQHQLLRSLEISLDEMALLAQECRTRGIRFLCTPFDVSMTAELVGMGMDRIKVASGELTNIPALSRFARFGLPVILSTGMAMIDEVDTAVVALRDGGAGDITLLHCTSLYPAPPESLNLRAMVTLAERFGLPVGYSDHSLDDYAAVAATALGATVIEKHFTLDRSLPGPDHRASLEPGELASMIARLEKTAAALGDGDKRPTPGEMETARLVRRSWHASRSLSAGVRLGETDVMLSRPGDGLAPADSPIGRVLALPLALGAPIRTADLLPRPVVIRILSVSTSRADIGILQPVWGAVAARRDCDLHVLLTGMHCVAEDLESVMRLDDATVHRGGADLGGRTGAEAARAMAAIAETAGACIAETCPDAVLVVGDRLDMMPVATAAVPFNVPLVHLHGGEVTEGAVDDRIRHAVTKLAHMHCVSSKRACERLLGMGEEPWRVHVTGAPGLDTLVGAPRLARREFLETVGMAGIDSLRLVTVHPETNAPDPLAPLDAVLGALETRPASTLITAPNSDPAGVEARRRIDTFVARNRWAAFRETLGPALYPNALRHAAVMVGNSSSGVIEAGLFGLPVINVGDRQAERERGSNVTDVENDARAVTAALDRLGAAPGRSRSWSPYGDGQSGPRVARVLENVPACRRLTRKRLPA